MEPNALVECANELMRALKEELAERGTVHARIHPIARQRLRGPHFLTAPVRIRRGKGGRRTGIPESRSPNRSAWRPRGARQQLLHPRPRRDERSESTTGTGRRRRRHRCVDPIRLREKERGHSA